MAAAADTIVSIQWMRALAALVVVLFHLDIAPWGASGVDVFFVISGFIMWRTTEQRNMDPATFYRHRIWRIVPIYWMYTILLALALLAMPSAFSRLEFDWAHFATSFFFIPWQSPTNGLLAPFLVQGWSLNYEMFFYLIFGAALMLAPRLRLAVVSGVLIGLVVLGLVVAPTSAAGRVYSDPLLLEFLAGVWIAWFWSRFGARLPVPFGLAMILTGLVCLVASAHLSDAVTGLQRLTVWGIPSVLMVVGALSIESTFLSLPAIGRLLGDASYSIYLSHTFIISVFAKIWTSMIGLPQGLMYGATGLFLCALAGWISYVLVERPVSRWGK